MTVRLTEADLDRLGRTGAISAMRSFLRAAVAGRTASPPRVSVPVGPRTLVFTIGGDLDRGVAGFRMYGIGEGEPPPGRPSEILSLLDLATGELLATAEGSAFGAWRTAALGGVALQEGLRGRSSPVPAAVVGAGLQAHHHARTWASTGLVSSFRVWARRPRAVEDFCARLARDAGLEARPEATADGAVRGAGAVLCATASPSPVFSVDALDGEAYVATVGPKFGKTHEVPADVYANAALLTDAPAQVANSERARGPLPGGRRASDAVSLADLVGGAASLPTHGVRLYVSHGLAGTEVALLHALWTNRPPP